MSTNATVRSNGGIEAIDARLPGLYRTVVNETGFDGYRDLFALKPIRDAVVIHTLHQLTWDGFARLIRQPGDMETLRIIQEVLRRAFDHGPDDRAHALRVAHAITVAADGDAGMVEAAAYLHWLSGDHMDGARLAHQAVESDPADRTLAKIIIADEKHGWLIRSRREERGEASS